jgi:adenosylcobinamide-GDP ribazoletransferase
MTDPAAPGEPGQRPPRHRLDPSPAASAAPPAAPRAALPARELRYALTALVYFTRIPLPAWLARWVGFDASFLAGAVRYFPLVGALVGALGAAVYLLAARIWPAGIAVLLSMVATVLVTGALHEDGLADCCDGLGGAYRREDALRIMQDSRLGAFGALGLALALLLKWQALAALPSARVAWLMIAAHAASRAAALSLMLTLDYVRSAGKAQALAHRLSAGAACVAALLGLIWLGWPNWRFGLVAVFGLGCLRMALARWYRRRLGGYTGDCLGMAQQLGEILIYLLALAWI